MSWQLNIFTVVAGIAALPLGGLTLAGWRQSKAAATAFGWLSFCGLLWAVCYGIQLGFTTLEGQLFWQRATIAVSSLVPPVLLAFALRYAGKADLLTTRLKAILALETTVFATVVLTNPHHHLVWTDATLRTLQHAVVLNVTFGIGYYLHIVYAYSVVTIALAVLFSVVLRSATVYHQQASLLILGAIPAFLSHITYTLGVSPIEGLDLTPFMFTVTTGIYGLALFHFDLLDQTPVARRNAIELMGDGLLVADARGVVVDANRIARQVYQIESGTKTFAQLAGVSDPETIAGTTMSAVVEGSRRVYDRHVSTLTDDYGEFTGHAVILRDVTDRDTYEQRLEVSNRILRHNIRNDMNIIQGYAELLSETVENPRHERMANTILEKATGLVSLSEKLRQTITYQRSQGERSISDVVAPLQRLLDEFRDEYPTVDFELDAPESVGVTGIAEQELVLAIRNLLENSVEHNELEGLDVRLSVQIHDRHVRIRVSDNGSGLPLVERRVLESRTETPLQHSSGIGLWMTRWIVDTSGGEMGVESDSTSGTTITVEFPRAE